MIEELAEKVYSILGPGYNECVYHNAMEVLLRQNGIAYETERIVPIPFEGHIIGNLRADIIINKHTILELKAVKSINESMECQARNYLKLLNLTRAYLINFPQSPGSKVEIRCIEQPEEKMEALFSRNMLNVQNRPSGSSTPPR